mgnify:FL=1|jgi:phenylalanyl-tRNA synthetase beta chain|tara:strand:+ start:7529 stop:9934 length:2406 start_codon:yes stop_codon:yes gene_type:complete
MKFTINWLKDHLDTKKSEQQITDALNKIGLEVESVEPIKNELSNCVVARIIKAEKHPNADRLKVCDVDIGGQNILKVVCGASNAQDGLLTIYAPPGSIIPKNNMKLEVSKIRGVTSYGMLCSEAELNISNESQGIISLSEKYNNMVGKSYFSSKKENTIELSVTPNRPDCLGIRGIARDLAAAGMGKIKPIKSKKLKQISKKLNVVISKTKNQSCSIFGSCLITNIKNQESPNWLKERLISVGLRPISAVVDITNFIMLDLNRPLHAYDLDKINKRIIVRESKKNETLNALDNKKYNLSDGMCVISDESGPLGLGGIIGGTSSSTEIDTKNILIESAYFDPSITRKTSNILNLNSDANYRFERGIDPNSIETGLQKAAEMITEICGGEVSKFKITKTKKLSQKEIKLDNNFPVKVLGIKINVKEIINILEKLGFKCKKNSNTITIRIPSWRPDITGKIDLVEEIIRIKGLEKIESIEPEKIRTNQTLNNEQKHFRLTQRSIATKGYLEAITWSFTNEKINNYFLNTRKSNRLINPISSDLGVLRSSIFSNLVEKIRENIDRGDENISLFEIGPIFKGKNPGEQTITACGISAGYAANPNWNEKGRFLDVFDVKRDLLHTLYDLGTNKNEITIETKNLPDYYHPGKGGTISFSNNPNNYFASFGELHPNIINQLDIKTNSLVGFELNLDEYVKLKEKINKSKISYEFSEYQKSERDFAFIVDKNIQAQELLNLIKNVDLSLIKDISIFDLYEGENIPSGKKSLAFKVIIQSDEKTLTENDINTVSQKIVKIVEDKTGSKLRS